MTLKNFSKLILLKPFSEVINYFLRVFNIFIIYRIGHAIGDQLCMTAVVRLINQNYSLKIIVISSYPEIFVNNPRIFKNFGVFGTGLFLSRLLRSLSGTNIENFLFTHNKFLFEEYMRINGRSLHLVQAHTMHFKINLDFSEIMNEIYFSASEIETYEKKFNLPKFFSVIQPNSKKSYTPNKQWEISNYQIVIDNQKNIKWLQVGADNEFLLNNVLDFRGKTSLRELFYIVSKARFVFASEGLINHIASAFQIQSYVISSGFSSNNLSNYKNTVFFDSIGSCGNSPCWLLKECGVNGKPCLSNIDPIEVANKLI
jgi:hypothetical protein